jgi:hypothetical protein
MRRSRVVLALLIAPLAALPGCGSGDTVWASGRLVKGGDPYVAPPDQSLQVTFISTDATAGKAGEYGADVDQAKGTFVLSGAEGQGIPPGKYRVVITQKLRREAFDAARAKSRSKKRLDREDDTLGGRFGAASSTVILREVKPGGGEMVIDLDKPLETAQVP